LMDWRVRSYFKAEVCALVGYCAAYIGQKIQEAFFLDFLTLKDETERYFGM